MSEMSEMTELHIWRALNACVANGRFVLPSWQGNQVLAFVRTRLSKLAAAEKEGKAEPTPEQKDILERLAVLEGRADAMHGCHVDLGRQFDNHNHDYHTTTIEETVVRVSTTGYPRYPGPRLK